MVWGRMRAFTQRLGRLAGLALVPACARCSDGFSLLGGDEYKQHFSRSYDQSALRDSPSPDPAQAELRRTIARRLMAKLGYRPDELALLGPDVLRAQGVKSPFGMAQLRPGERVLDLGSGYGLDCFLAAAKVGPRGRVVGLDLSAEEVKLAAERAAGRGCADTVRFVVGDMEQIPLPAGSVDCVISNGGFCLCPDKQRAFEQVLGVLKPGGRCAIACTVLLRPLPDLKGKRWPPCMEVFMQRSQIESTLARIGFVRVVIDESDTKMDVYELKGDDLDTLVTVPKGCSHARKAAERQAAERVSQYLSSERPVGIHWGDPQYDFTKEVDMNELCARVVIFAEKPAASDTIA